MGVVADIIGVVKTNTKGLCKETIDNPKNYWQVGSYLVLRSKPMVPRGRKIIDIGDKYNVGEVIYFICYRKRRDHTGRSYLFI